ncbi:MAG: pyruvate kinase [Candidatus Marinimicrobia bacterium]|nr:pyruvate kinase [Candidatus Neomarinimicrobiota bacterium]MCF7828876.1 pyruvate kinase [Candidatus Neomarinimicrobiota bacterium]MCF7880794.1 pyruvate kinase [Candidatus Neomarinimicrobiota bacterium]
MNLDNFAKTKIIATVGPASTDEKVLREMIRHGVDVIRINSAHGSQKTHEQMIEMVRAFEEEEGKPLSILYDLAGPKIRLGELPDDGIMLEDGTVLTLEEGTDGPEALPVECPAFASMLEPGKRIFINDGAIQLTVIDIAGKKVKARVDTGGLVTSRKGVNLPDTDIDLPALSKDDKANLRFGLHAGVDWFALSFVREAENIKSVYEVMREEGICKPIVAKIETPQAIREIDEIIEAFQGVMVARGDLGVELPIENVPHLQKQLIQKCNQAGKPVITATQMLESMIENNRPTRAEAADVANAIYDGTDCVMLSGETAVGKYPVVAVDMMNSIILSTEREINYSQRRYPTDYMKSIADSVSHAVFQAAIDVRAKAIVTFTQSGSTARMVSKYRPPAPIYALTPSVDIQRQLNLVWGVHPLRITNALNTDEMFDLAEAHLKELGVVIDDDRIVLSAGVPIGVPGTTNLMKVQVVGDKGEPADEFSVT